MEVIDNKILPQARGLVEKLSMRLGRYAPNDDQPPRVSLVCPCTFTRTIVHQVFPPTHGGTSGGTIDPK